MEVTEYSSWRVASDLDCIAIWPKHPEYMIIGTYDLIKRKEGEDPTEQARKGSIEVVPISPPAHYIFGGIEFLPTVADHKFDAAVLDLRFHPKDGSLLGVALSNGTIHFFRLEEHAGLLHDRWAIELYTLGHVQVNARDTSTAQLPVITQFQWLPDLCYAGTLGIADTLTVTAAVTLDSGVVKMLRMKIPATKLAQDQRRALEILPRKASGSDIHTHSLEAWCVTLIDLPDAPNNYLLLSGGDDSVLLGSLVTLMDPAESSMRPRIDLFNDDTSPHTISCFRDRRNHEAGVTAILPLPCLAPPTKDSIGTLSSKPPYDIPVLTGSYDDKMRLFTISSDPVRFCPQPSSTVDLEGGVWRMQLMDHYFVADKVYQPDEKSHLRYQKHYIVLVCCMYAGAKIVRVIVTCHDDSDSSESEQKHWRRESEIRLEAVFTRGHKSMVYACGFIKQWSGAEDEDSARMDVSMRPKTKTKTKTKTKSPKRRPAPEHELELGPEPRPRSRSISAPPRLQSGGLDGQMVSRVKRHFEEKKADKAKAEEDEEESEARSKDGTDNVGRYLIVSTSFYDKSICVWKWKDTGRQHDNSNSSNNESKNQDISWPLDEDE